MDRSKLSSPPSKTEKWCHCIYSPSGSIHPPVRPSVLPFRLLRAAGKKLRRCVEYWRGWRWNHVAAFGTGRGREDVHCPGRGTTMFSAFRVILACCATGCCVWRRAACLSSESTPLYLRSAYPLWDPESTPSHSAAEPLLLTPYLRNGNILRAKQLARVTEVYLPHHVVSYSGYFTVDDQHNSNLFFWFFPATVTAL